MYVVWGFMVENEPNINVVDKSVKFGRHDCFDILIRKSLASRKNPPLTHFGVIYIIIRYWMAV